ncbi:hypothetical protein [Morganella morganii]|uniref:hypothetical protein n=1 Tax=Morganella morganii TaxID=582 RepID=UPI00202542AA|nr:hypothetical protein [Morganella morganii]
MEFKGTPGPWLHEDSHGLNETAGGAIHGDGKTLCLVLGKGIGKEKATANAKLMAAAPDLLEALIELRKLVTHHDQADAAINKALGG